MGLLGPRNYSLAWTLPCGLGRLWALAVSVAPEAGTERGTGVPREISGLINCPQTGNSTANLQNSAQRAESKDDREKQEEWRPRITEWHLNSDPRKQCSRCSRQSWKSWKSWKAACGRGRDHSLLLPRRYFLGGVEARGQEQRENPRPLLQCVLRRGWWSLGAHQNQATVIHSPRTAESLGRPLKSSAVSFVRRLVGLGV